MRQRFEVADVFRAHGEAYRETYGEHMPLRQHRAMRAIETCRTAELGGHVEECDRCGHLRISYNSCRNRHCPKCQQLKKEQWMEERNKDLLPIRYFHMVFTLPQDLRPIALRNQRIIYNLLFKAASETLLKLTQDPRHLGAQIGFIALLHTWSQTLIDHPHIHCIVTGGGLSFDGKRWIGCKKRKFLIHVEILSQVFRGKFLSLLKHAYGSGKMQLTGEIAHLANEQAFKHLLRELYNQGWVVYCKPSLKNAQKTFEYLGRYTHRVALSNERIVGFNDDRVAFTYRDSSDHDKVKRMTLDAFEFIRRFLLHILPDGFMKIRHFGILSNRNRKTKLARCKQLLRVKESSAEALEQTQSWRHLLLRVAGIDLTLCPCCGKGKMILKEALAQACSRSPP